MATHFKKTIIFIIVGMLTILMGSDLGQASEFNFSVVPEIPSNQIDKTKSYFDLKMEKSDEQILKVNLKNDTQEEVTVLTEINRATTNLNGVVEYGNSKQPLDNSMKFDIEKLTEVPKEVKLKPGSSEVVEIKVTAPTENFDGVIAGGITFKEKSSENESKDQSEGVSIKNDYSYVVALLIQQNDKFVEPNIELLEASASQNNARNVINATLQNNQPVYINQVKAETIITKANSTEVLYANNQSGMQIAPNSTFDFPTPLNGAKLKSGKYNMSVIVYGGKNTDGKFKDKDNVSYRYMWQSEKEFTVKSELADALNKKDVEIKKDYRLLILVIVIFIFLLLLIIWKRNRKKKALLVEARISEAVAAAVDQVKTEDEPLIK